MIILVFLLWVVLVLMAFCLNQTHKKRLVLWNPTTGEFKVIRYAIFDYVPPHCQPDCTLHGFGYDHVTNDYKVIQFVDSYIIPIGGEEEEDEEFVYVEEDEESSFETSFWMIYSLRSNSWRKLNLNLPNRYCFTPNRRVGAYTNGVCHWWAIPCSSSGIPSKKEYLLSFNFSNELMCITPTPSYLGVRPQFPPERCLAVLNETIALMAIDLEMTNVQISILGELGVRESWTKLLTVRLTSFMYPVGVGNLSNIVLFKKKYNRLAWMDLNTKMMEELDVEARTGALSVYVGKYKKSFLPM